jgi:zinc transport system permease protein
MTGTPTFADLIQAWPLFRDPILCALAAGASLGGLGILILLRRMVFISAALAQAAGLGVALAFYVQIHWGAQGLWGQPSLWALGTTLLAAMLLRWEPPKGLNRDSLLGLVYLLGTAGALIIGTRISQEAHDIQSILFGSAVMVREQDVTWVLLGSAIVMAFLLWWRRGLFLAALHPESAKVQGLPVALLDALLMVAIALMVSISARALGALPVFAFSVLPAVAAMAITPSPGWALGVAMAGGALAGGGGYLMAFFGEFPVGASQTMASGVLVILALGAGLIWRRLAGSTTGSTEDPAPDADDPDAAIS